MTGMHVGLSRFAHKGPSLLRQIGGVPRTTRCKTPEDINAPPLDSDDEDGSDGAPGGEAKHRPERSDASATRPRKGERVAAKEDEGGSSESEIDSPKRNDMKRTIFRPASDGPGRQNRGNPRPPPLGSKNGNSSSKEQRGVKRRASAMNRPGDDSVSGSPEAKRRSLSPRRSSKRDSHLTDAYGWAKTKSSARGYGNKAPKPPALKPTKTRESESRSPCVKGADTPSSLTPSSSKRSSARSYRIPQEMPSSPEKERGVTSTSTLTSARARKARGSRYRKGGDMPGADSESEEKTTVTYKQIADLPDSETDEDQKLPSTSLPKLNPKDKKSLDKSSQLLHQVLAKPAFKNPAKMPGLSGLDEDLENQLLGSDDETPLPNSGSGLEDVSDAPTKTPSEPEPRPGHGSREPCPMCSQLVDRDLLRTFGRGSHLSISMQIKFCRLHKKRAAETTWEENGYPTIDWHNLELRCAEHDKFLRRIINGSDSYYRSILANRVSKGQERTLRKTERSLAPGYYGPRGLRAMSEHVVGRFASTLRKQAVEDAVVSARGTAVFVSTVLVPELAVRLIMEDMRVNDEEARSILESSVEVGELLNEELLDKVEDRGNGNGSDVEDVFL